MHGVAGVQLALFETGPDIATIRAKILVMERTADKARNTITGYARDWRNFAAWCAEAGREALPSTADTLLLYVAARLDGGWRVSTAERHITAIADRHRSAGVPVPDGKLAWEHLARTRRARKEVPRGRLALTPQQVQKICNRCCRENTPLASRARATVLLGMSTSLRASNLVALDLADVQFVPNKGVAVSVRSSKTDQTGKGKLIGVRYGKMKATCPVRALKDWLKLRGLRPGPLFTTVRRYQRPTLARLQPKVIWRIVKDSVKAIGLDPSPYGSHSLRAGFVTAAHLEHTDVLGIMEVTGHTKVETVRKYLRNADPFAGPNPLGNAL